MIPCWRLWKGIVGEYWLGPWRLVVNDLGGDVGIALTVPVEDHLIIALDRVVLNVLADDDRLSEIGNGLRQLLQNPEELNNAGVYASMPLSHVAPIATSLAERKAS
jgi:hypothetical protein